MYSVRFNEEEECKLFKVGMLVFYSPDYANFVFTQTLKVKGTDASNLHDEEIGDDDKEFSDVLFLLIFNSVNEQDDAELEHKRRKKMAKKECEPKSRKERPFTQNDRNPHGGNSNRNGSFNLYDESRQSSLGKDEGEPNKNGYRSNYSEINPNHTLNHQHQNSHLNRQYHTNYINNNSQNQNNPNQSYQSSNVNQNNLNYVPYMPSSGQYYAMNNNYGMNVMQQHQNQQQQDRSHNHHQNHQQYQQHHGDINQEMMQAIYLQQFQQMQQMYGTNHEYVRNPNGYEANNR